MPLLYVVCQGQTRAPMLVGWVKEAWSVIETEPESNGWSLKMMEADEGNDFRVRDVVSLVAETMGPVLILGQLKRSTIARLKERLGLRVIVTHCAEISDPNDVLVALPAAIARHTAGDPQVPRRLAVALMLIRKLDKGSYWGGGAKAKAFLSVEELAKGRGLDEQYRDAAPVVANMLRMKGLLTKKTGDGHTKYALNSDRREEIYEFLNSWRVADDKLSKFLYGDPASVSVRELDDFILSLDATDEPDG